MTAEILTEEYERYQEKQLKQHSTKELKENCFISHLTCKSYMVKDHSDMRNSM